MINPFIKQIIKILFERVVYICIPIILNLPKSLMEEESNKNKSQVMELQEVSLFEEDPYFQQISTFEQNSENVCSQNHLLDGEVLLHQKIFRIEIESDSCLISGRYETLTSNYRAICFASQQQVLTYGNAPKQQDIPLSVPFSIMSEIDIIKSQIFIKLKTGLTIRIRSSVIEIQQLYRHFLKAYMAIPFFPKCLFPQEDSISYDCLVQMQRMRMNWDYLIIVKNANGQLCSTYPKYFIVPRKVEQNLLEECLKIRNESRVPVATYYWVDSKAALWRTAKLKSNQYQNNKFNQAYMKQINRQPFFIDLKEEQSNNRSNFHIQIFNVAFKYYPLPILNNIFQRLCVSYAKNDKEIMKILQRWFQDIFNLLKAAYLAADQMRLGKQVVLVETLGLDRGCQVSALTQLIIEPYYRTVNGLSILIQKQFVSFGHPFNFRFGFEREKLVEESPVFLQFLECVYHLTTTHPKCFEFSGYYLARLGYEAFTAKYNNFFFNDEQLRKKYEHFLKTPNIWKHLPMRKQYYNYQWSEKEAIKPLLVLRPMPSMKELIVWRQFYDMVSQLRCQYGNESNVRKRRSSIYKLLVNRRIQMKNQ